jgi:hypothetical protein
MPIEIQSMLRRIDCLLQSSNSQFPVSPETEMEKLRNLINDYDEGDPGEFIHPGIIKLRFTKVDNTKFEIYFMTGRRDFHHYGEILIYNDHAEVNVETEVVYEHVTVSIKKSIKNIQTSRDFLGSMILVRFTDENNYNVTTERNRVSSIQNIWPEIGSVSNLGNTDDISLDMSELGTWLGDRSEYEREFSYFHPFIKDLSIRESGDHWAVEFESNSGLKHYGILRIFNEFAMLIVKTYVLNNSEEGYDEIVKKYSGIHAWWDFLDAINGINFSSVMDEPVVETVVNEIENETDMSILRSWIRHFHDSDTSYRFISNKIVGLVFEERSENEFGITFMTRRRDVRHNGKINILSNRARLYVETKIGDEREILVSKLTEDIWTLRDFLNTLILVDFTSEYNQNVYTEYEQYNFIRRSHWPSLLPGNRLRYLNHVFRNDHINTDEFETWLSNTEEYRSHFSDFHPFTENLSIERSDGFWKVIFESTPRQKHYGRLVIYPRFVVFRVRTHVRFEETYYDITKTYNGIRNQWDLLAAINGIDFSDMNDEPFTTTSVRVMDEDFFRPREGSHITALRDLQRSPVGEIPYNHESDLNDR